MQSGKVGLALGAGAARGLAHIGVLEVLEREGIPIDMIAGSSIGALVGAVYAQGRSISQMKSLAIEWGAKRVSLLADPALLKTGLIRGRKIENALKSIIGDVEFGDLRMPFACVATDIDTGEEVVIREGAVWKAVRASSSVPVLLTLAKREGRYLVDGGLVNPVPVSVLKAMGADFIIVVNVLSANKNTKEAKEPNIFSVIMKTISIYSYRIIESSLKGADVVIEPDTTNVAFLDFHRAEECIQLGELAAQDLIPEVKRRYSARFQDTLSP